MHLPSFPTFALHPILLGGADVPARSGSWRSTFRSWGWAVLASMVRLAGTLQAEEFTFDEPGYAAGQRAPNPPWITGFEWNGQSPTDVPRVVAGQGVGGSQCLSLLSQGSTFSAMYIFPRELTQADGAQRISMKYAPPPYLGRDNNGSLFFGSAYLGSGPPRAVVFQAFSFQAVSGPPGGDPLVFRAYAWRGGVYGIIDGGELGEFVPGGGFYELIFDISADWTQITNTLVTPSGGVRSVVQPHNPAFALQWIGLDGSIYVPGGALNAEPALYDDICLPEIAAKFADRKSVV